MNVMQTIVVPTRKQIEELEQYVLKLPQVEMPIVNEFCNGLYARTMFIPAGTLLTGAIHKEENFLFVREGDIAIWTEAGMQRIAKGAMVKSGVGAKRIGLTFEDTVLTTVHFNPTNEKDGDKLWDLFTVPSDYVLNSDEKQFELLES